MIRRNCAGRLAALSALLILSGHFTLHTSVARAADTETPAPSGCYSTVITEKQRASVPTTSPNVAIEDCYNGADYNAADACTAAGGTPGQILASWYEHASLLYSDTRWERIVHIDCWVSIECSFCD